MTSVLKRPRGRPKDEDLKSRRQEEILDVSAKVFARHGFPNTDVQVIADQLGVGKGTIYRYFPTKRDLFLATIERGVRRLQEATDAHAASASDPLERIIAAIHSYLEFFDENPEMVEL